MASLTLELVPPFAPRVEATWRALEERARPPYFLSWGWVETWRAMVPRADAPPLAVVSERGLPVAAFFAARRRLLRHHLFPSRARFVNATGVPRLDELCAEHNTILHAPAAALDLAALVELLPHDWDELFLPAVDPDAFPDLDRAPRGCRLCVDHDVAAPFVDLARVRAAPGGYLEVLGSATRAHLRRARRAAAALGRVELEVATEPAQALAIYGELVELHQQAWRARGEPGAFADPWFDRFHRRLIATRLPHGEIELVRLRAGGRTLGCLYNLVAHGRVLFYQSGLAPTEDPHLRPGYLCHAAAIERDAAAGHEVYDLLGGDAPYKRHLATDAARLLWVRVQRRLARFAIEDRLRRWKHALAPR